MVERVGFSPTNLYGASPKAQKIMLPPRKWSEWLDLNQRVNLSRGPKPRAIDQTRRHSDMAALLTVYTIDSNVGTRRARTDHLRSRCKRII